MSATFKEQQAIIMDDCLRRFVALRPWADRTTIEECLTTWITYAEKYESEATVAFFKAAMDLVRSPLPPEVTP